MYIRNYKPADKTQLQKICLENSDIFDDDAEISKYILLMFCNYYIEKEANNCFVATDDNGVPVGYVYGTEDFDRYFTGMAEYLKKISELKNSSYLADATVEMYNHYIYKDEYPAHLHIDVLSSSREKGTGTKLINTYCDELKRRGINGVMLIVGSDNVRGRRFYEKSGFKLLKDSAFGASFGKKLK